MPPRLTPVGAAGHPVPMKRSSVAAGLLGLVLPAACAPDPAPVPDAPSVLVFSRTAGYRHASIEPGIEAIREIGQADGFEVVATEDPSVFGPVELRRFAAVVFLSTTGDVLDDAQQEVFEDYIRAGGAFVGIHAAADTEFDWPWYGRLVGGWVAGHPNDPNVREGVLRVADPGHPSTESLPDPWVRRDEWYDYGDLAPGLGVLLEVDERSYKRPEEGPAPSPRPIAWYHEFDGGRAWYTGLGHTSESFGEAAFVGHLRGGLRYALGR